MKIKKVLYVISGRSFRGGQLNRKIRQVIAAWRALGFDVLVVAGGDLGPSANTDRAAEYGNASHYKVWYRRIPAVAPIINTSSEFRDCVHDRKLRGHLEKMLKDFEPDLIWERSSRLHFAGASLAHESCLPYVLEWKDNLLSYGISLGKSRARKIEKLKEELAAAIVVESHVLAGRLAKDGLAREKLIVAHNAVDSGEFTSSVGAGKLRSASGIDDDTMIVGYLGSFAFYHDTACLVRAANLVRELSKLSVVLIGAGKERDECKDLARGFRLAPPYLHFLPPVLQMDVPSLLQEIDVGVLPGSTDIICPIKVQEYMAAGLSVVAPDYACNREIVKHGENGLLFEPGNPESLAGCLRTLSGDPELRSRLGRQARLDAAQKYSWRATWGQAMLDAVEVVARSMSGSE